MPEITEAQVKELLELSARASKGPWEVETVYMEEPGYEEFIKRQAVTTAPEIVTEDRGESYEAKYTIARMDWSNPVTANAELMAAACNLLPALAESWLEMAGEVEQLRKDNAEHLKIGTIAYNALFLVCESLARNTKIDDERCAQCTKINEHYKKYPGIPSFLNCTSCQFKRWMDAGEEMNNDPELKTWAEADTPEKAIDLLFPESPKEAAHD